MKVEFDDTFDVAPQGVNVCLENEVPESEVSILDNRIPRPSFTVGNVRNDGEARLEKSPNVERNPHCKSKPLPVMMSCCQSIRCPTTYEFKSGML